ncbi:hypothetical protein SteCoe_4275 [Stentor coeruleus]|uniref:Uncharacterized protein n=1 Tax=Stentor coeruleus TaxID=5963 RepID=A0A1R2CUY8_9CILI|nr:hypothetical protein SteCoe_4275 [Stentor coeruleus]
MISLSEKKSGTIMKVGTEELGENENEKYTEYCIGQVEKELEGLGLSNEDFSSILHELKELRRLLDNKPMVEEPQFVNHESEIERLLQANLRLEDEIAELQRKEEEIITKKWW